MCEYLYKKLVGDEVYYHCEMDDNRLCQKEYDNYDCPFDKEDE